MKRLLLLLALAAVVLFASAPTAAIATSPPNTDFQAQLFAEQLVSIDLVAAADSSQLALTVDQNIGTSVPGARRGGLPVAFYGFDSRRSPLPSPPARAVRRGETC